MVRLRGLCLALPEANEKISHGEPTWKAGKGKVFAMLDNHHHGAPHLSAWLPAGLGAQEALIESDPKRFFRPPYVGHLGWVGVVLDTSPNWTLVAWLVEQAYRLVQTHAMRAWEEEGDFRAAIENDPEIRAAISPGKIAEAFSLERQLRNVDRIFARVFRS